MGYHERRGVLDCAHKYGAFDEELPARQVKRIMTTVVRIPSSKVEEKKTTYNHVRQKKWIVLFMMFDGDIQVHEGEAIPY